MEHAFPKPVEVSSDVVHEVVGPTLDTIYKEVAEFDNMIGVVEVRGSPITNAILECLYGS